MKRIVPASALVVTATVLASFLVLNSARAWSVFWDGFWASVFVASWRFASVGTDYFQADGPVSPLQHFWTLAVEEQFYFVWPWIMLLVLAHVSRKASRHARLAVAASIVILSIASFVWALNETQGAPTIAYFSTLTRAWELGFGALLAISSPLLPRIPHVLRPFLTWTRIATMAWSMFFISEGRSFPAPAALAPVLGVGLVLRAGVGGDQKTLAILTNPVAGYIGNTSYSLYLWHFPVIVLVLPLLPCGPLWNNVAAKIIMGALAIAAYHLWEDTIRRSPWFDGGHAWIGYKIPAWWKYGGLATFAGATAVLVAVAMFSVAPKSEPQAAASAPVGTANDELHGTIYGPEVTELQPELASALQATSWPKTEPSLDAAIGSEQGDPANSDCGKTATSTSSTDCTFGDLASDKHAYLVGDPMS